MAYIEPRVSRKTGKVSYIIHVYDGRTGSGKRRTFARTYHPQEGLSPTQVKRFLQRAAQEFEDECKNPLGGANSDIRLADFAEIYLEAMADKLSPTVYGGYVKTMREMILPELGELKMAVIKPLHVQKFVRTLSSRQKRRRDGTVDVGGGVISASTVKRRLCVLQSMFTFAVKMGLLESSPADSKRLSLPKPVKPHTEIFTMQETSLMLNALKYEPLQFRVLIYLAVFSGAREGELVALRFSDIDFDVGKLTISRSAYKLTGEPVKLKSPKSSRTRSVALNPMCLMLIDELREQRQFALGNANEDFDDWLFHGNNGGIMNPYTPSRQFTAFLRRRGLSHRKFHALRHTSATLLLYNGTDIKTVQERLGHADFTTTGRYLHLMDSADVNAVRSLETALFDERPCRKRRPERPGQTQARI
ncbi:MAG: site-specific integrase [Ruminococcus sp.]|nr:site-specific integrase [Ruminococcus sp.]